MSGVSAASADSDVVPSAVLANGGSAALRSASATSDMSDSSINGGGHPPGKHPNGTAYAPGKHPNGTAHAPGKHPNGTARGLPPPAASSGARTAGCGAGALAPAPHHGFGRANKPSGIRSLSAMSADGSDAPDAGLRAVLQDAHHKRAVAAGAAPKQQQPANGQAAPAAPAVPRPNAAGGNRKDSEVMSSKVLDQLIKEELKTERRQPHRVAEQV